MSAFPSDRVVAVIPARGGSKGVPGKNLARVGGVPLVARAVAAALAAGVADVRVSTDDAGIAAAARAAGAGVIERPADLAGDTASSESALLHALDALEAEGVRPEALAFLQATSPFLEPAALRRAVERVLARDADSVLAAFETYAFLWRADERGLAVAVNHDAAARPRRQEREPHFQETGAFYVLRTAGFREHRHRFFGRTALEVVAESRALEIDSSEQLGLARGLAPLLDPRPAAVDVDALITDFDGVHTDDTATVSTDGTESVRVSRSDGLGVERLLAAGVPVLILSKERNAVVAARAAKLRVPVLHGVEDKAAAVRRWCAETGTDPSRVAYVGNDVNDLPALQIVGWPIAVADAHPAVRAAARLVLTRRGGHGAVREAAELVLAATEGRNTSE
ncbi:acylneuraminate cytidylyltransferase [Amnibacterium sp. CER49]|uniref:acylneuraminate cytidylyltransferase n=1 Tax=Amnibacterium sp. CER49 TaxID=3039161 RepID=UPI002447A5E2|nr:acylneuraminate cytidylyltransferase [Amnibacterium sp. CER49]MDH2445225.1 acylneuraminate cytidylyltransferase [Amnibacterium sp. CER49]